MPNLWISPRSRAGLLCLSVGTFVFAEHLFDNWSTNNGLPQNGIREVTQTPEEVARADYVKRYTGFLNDLAGIAVVDLAERVDS